MAKKRFHSGMISEDRSSVANMPQSVVYKAYPSTEYSSLEGYNDKLSGIDSQMKKDIKGKKNPTKY